MNKNKFYSKYINIKNNLTKEEQTKYILLAQQGDKSAETKLVENNLGLVVYVVNKYFINSDIDKDDLFQVGCIGLMKAIKRFDTSLKMVFSTYAVPTIWGEIKRHTDINSSILKIPNTIRSLLIKIIKLKNNNIENKNLTIENMSNILNVDELEIILALHSNKDIKSISEPIKTSSFDGDVKLEDLIPSNDLLTEEIVVKNEIKNLISKLIEKLDIREQIIIRYTYGINCKEKTQKEIAEILNISTSRVGHIKRRVISELKFYLSNRSEFLDLLGIDNKLIYSV